MSILRFMTVVISFVSVGSLAQAQVCDCDVTIRMREANDRLLQLSPAERQTALDRHLPLGVPSGPGNATNEQLLIQDNYIINYDADLRVPIWVAYRLREIDLLFGRARTECFRHDLRIAATASATCGDYSGSGFHRGHLVPNAAMVRSEAAMVNTYMLSNMAPQHPKFNSGIWNSLESRVRKWAVDKGEIYIISGSVFDHDMQLGRDTDASALAASNIANRVAIPSHFYKIIHHTQPDGTIETLTILLPHNNQSHGSATVQMLTSSITTIDAIEARTGINFFPAYEQAHSVEAAALEQAQAPALWPR